MSKVETILANQRVTMSGQLEIFDAISFLPVSSGTYHSINYYFTATLHLRNICEYPITYKMSDDHSSNVFTQL